MALVFAIASALMIPNLFTRMHGSGILPQLRGAPVKPHAVFLLILARLVLVLPAALAILYGMAWWKARKDAPSARGWALAASLAMVLQCIPFAFAAYYLLIFDTRRRSALTGILDLGGAMLLVGVAGILAFAKPGADHRQAPIPARTPRIAGDGTSGFSDLAVGAVAIAGYLACEYLWSHWGRSQHLPFARGGLFWVLFLSAGLLETAAHECGHAIAGLALAMRVRAFIVGPFHWMIRDGRWRFQFLLAKSFSLGGATAVVPTDPKQSHWNEVAMIAAGPAASLLSGLAALCVMLTAKGTGYERSWELFALVATFGAVAFAVNLIPARPDALYSDGAQIYQILRGGPWADLHRALSIAAASSVTPLRPREYDIEAIERVARAFPRGPQAVQLRLLASSCFLDRDDTLRASEAVNEAESAYQESPFDASPELCQALVFRIALLRRDAAAARQWWQRMETHRPSHLGANYWLAQSALFFSENRLEEAREAWNKGNALAQQRPQSGDQQFDLYRCALLRRAIDAAVPALVAGR